ncbi:MAG: 8-amino-7-oxononanoate synthase [Bacteroidota bacterium]|nr:8-amino-7-oxononanoate synthase [Bacteroidota bacterium]
MKLRKDVNIERDLEDALYDRREEGNERRLPTQQGGLDFCSNDYLGFATSEALESQLQSEIALVQPLRLGATGSRLLTGNSPLYQRVEQQVAAFHGSESALIFPSGYSANLGLLSSVPKKGDVILYDELCHASIRDGIRLSNAKAYRFKHNNLRSLGDLLKRNGETARQLFVVTESVFSMDGDLAPLKGLVRLCKRWKASLIVDEAHAVGVIGRKGEGLVSHLGFQDAVFARVITFSKAIGNHGGAVLGSRVLRDYLVNFARPLIYTTGLPDLTLVHIRVAYQKLSQAKAPLEQLEHNVQYFIQNLEPRIRRRMIRGITPINVLLVQGNQRVVRLADHLQEKGFDVRPILHPTVPKGRERLRIVIHSFNDPEDILKLCQTLNAYSFQ